MFKFSFLLPTRDRANLVYRFFKSLLETTRNPNSLEILLYIDEDDEQSQKIHFPEFTIKKIVGPRRSMGAVNQILYEESRGKYIVFMNDDVIFRSKNWDREVLKAFAEFPDEIAMVYVNDAYYGPRVSTFPILSRKACELIGTISPASYARHCIDSHLYDIFERLAKKGLKRHVYLKDVVFEHMHFGLGLQTYPQGAVSVNKETDQEVFVRFTDEREKGALKLADSIRAHQTTNKRQNAPEDHEALISLIYYPENARAPKLLESLRAIHADLKNQSLIREILIPEAFKNILLDFSDEWIRGRFKFYLPPLSKNQADSLSGEYFAFLDTESVPLAGWLSNLFEEARKYPGTITASKWLHPRNGRIEHFGIALSKMPDGFTQPSYLFRGVDAHSEKVNVSTPVWCVELSGMLIPKGLFQGLEGFKDENFRLAQLDLCLRARAEGHKILLVPNAALSKFLERSILDEKKEVLQARLRDYAPPIESDSDALISGNGIQLELHAKRQDF